MQKSRLKSQIRFSDAWEFKRKRGGGGGKTRKLSRRLDGRRWVEGSDQRVPKDFRFPFFIKK